MSGVLGGLIAAFPTPVTGAFESIATYLGDDTASTFTFSSIPQTYKSLHIRVLGRDTYAGTGLNAFKMQPNSDATSGYSHHKLEGEGTAASSSGNTSPSFS